jgi:hypothetical protein
MTEAGWYPDPSDARQQRYWDGTGWTANVAPGAMPPMAGSQGTSSGTIIAIVLGVVALVCVPLFAIVAIRFLGTSAEQKFSSVGSAITGEPHLSGLPGAGEPPRVTIGDAGRPTVRVPLR